MIERQIDMVKRLECNPADMECEAEALLMGDARLHLLVYREDFGRGTGCWVFASDAFLRAKPSD